MFDDDTPYVQQAVGVTVRLHYAIDLYNGEFRQPEPEQGGSLQPAGSDGRAAIAGVRPEHFALADDGVEAVVQVVEPTGSETQVVARLGQGDVIAVFRERHPFKPGDRIRLRPDPKLVHLFDEATGKRLTN